jgi:hypothetical protein
MRLRRSRLVLFDIIRNPDRGEEHGGIVDVISETSHGAI